MQKRTHWAAIMLLTLGFAANSAMARGFGGAAVGGGYYRAAVYGSYNDPSADSSMFYGSAFTPYGAEGTGANRAPIGVYGANQSGGTAASPVGAYTGYPSGLGSGGGGLRDFADFPADSPARMGNSYLTSGTSWSQGGSWFPSQPARLPTDIGLSGAASASAGAMAHSTIFMSKSEMAGQARAVRASFDCYDAFTPAWYAATPKAWTAGGGAPFDAWGTATAASLAGWCGITAKPQYFDYGNNIVVAEGHVYVNGTDSGTAEQYAQQAISLAEQGRAANAGGPWTPLGVYALAQSTEGTSNQVFELAIDKDGVIRGNFWEPQQKANSLVVGKADKSSMRAAWAVGDNNKIVFETGLFNLTSVHSPLIVHFGTDKTRQWLLVRITPPSASNSGK